MHSNEINKINSIPQQKDRASLVLILITIILNAACWALPYSLISRPDKPIILHYNIYFGVDLIGEWYRIFYLPGITLIFLLVNFLLGAIINKRYRVLARILYSAAVVIQSLALIATLLLININT